MSETVITATEIKANYPEFANIADTVIASVITLQQQYLSRLQWATKEVMMLAIAHELQLRQNTQLQRQHIMTGLGELNQSMNINSSAYWETSHYGQRVLLAKQQQVRSGFAW